MTEKWGWIGGGHQKKKVTVIKKGKNHRWENKNKGQDGKSNWNNNRRIDSLWKHE